MSGLIPQEEILPLVQAIQDIQWTRFALFASATIIFYDYAISVGREIDLVWRKEWSIIKAVFIFHRYFGVSGVCLEVAALMSNNLTDAFCSFWFHWETWGYSVLLFTTEVVLLLWIFVVYQKDYRVLAFMGMLLVGEMTAVIVILSKSFSSLDAKAGLIPGTSYCLISHAPNLLHVFWLPILAYHTFVLIFFLFKGYRVYAVESRRWHSKGLLAILYKDSLLNFLAIFGSYLSCAVIWVAAEPGLAQIPVCFALSFSVTNCNRLLLNIRHAYYKHAESTRYPATRQPTLQSPTTDRFASDTTLADGVPVTPTIYAQETPRDVWVFMLREMKWSG